MTAPTQPVSDSQAFSVFNSAPRPTKRELSGSTGPSVMAMRLPFECAHDRLELPADAVELPDQSRKLRQAKPIVLPLALDQGIQLEDVEGFADGPCVGDAVGPERL